MTATSRAEHGPVVDPRAPRFGQTITATLLVAGVALQTPLPVYVVATALATAVVSGWRVDVYGRLWRALLPLVGRPDGREPAAPHRFAKLLGAAGSGVASLLLLAEMPVLGYAVAAAVALAAGLAAATGICVGCRLYRQVGVARRLDLV